jgi:hypothetical protein
MAFIEKLARTTRDVSAMGPGFYLTRLRRRRRGERVPVQVRGVGALVTRHKSGDIAIEPDAGNAELCRLNSAGHANITVREAAMAGTRFQILLKGENLIHIRRPGPPAV